MDPDATLKQLRELCRQAMLEVDLPTFLAEDLAEQFQALDMWLSRGGFLPHAWDVNRDKLM